MSADPGAVAAACAECSRLRQAAVEPHARRGAPGPLKALARHLANRHLDLVPGWAPGCARCDELGATLREAAEQGLLGAGAAQAAAEHRALHLLAAPAAESG
ncbi:hypothetical protein ACWCQL_03375 [Streptomyces sp. NPDC002073]|uniref:hypothetical protein n=1 Tax=Streptomyces sp. NBC_00239 TaxID=2903640 RepID=UPI002E2CADA7|nr:hypothetical protein [Streptomyces sp. NBC_00239]